MQPFTASSFSAIFAASSARFWKRASSMSWHMSPRSKPLPSTFMSGTDQRPLLQ